jgi:1,4-dihydroxy-2-naphthoate octaprenyltransferase
LLPRWLAVIAGIVITTVHAQDLYDQEGDAARGRRTLPLVLGDAPARWVIAVCMLVWGVVCPGFWNATLTARAVSLGLAGWMALRVLVFRDVSSDRKSFVIWNIWMSFVYILPLCGR